MRSIILSLSLVFMVFSCEVGEVNQSPLPAEEGTNNDNDPKDTSPQVDGDTGDKEPATETDSDPVVMQQIQLSIKYSHACALLRSSGEVKCWGKEEYGRLGNGKESNNLGDEAGEMANLPFVDFGNGRTAKTISAGNEHTCAILDNDTVKCWGHGLYGRLGQGSENNIGDAPNEVRNMFTVDLGEGHTAKAVSAGWEHTCAILDNDKVKCWGNGVFGRLGYDNDTPKGDDSREMGEDLLTVNLGTSRTAKAISAGNEHTCAILDNDTVKCWGRGGSGELGQGSGDTLGNREGQMAALEAINLGKDRTVKAIASGYRYNCALLDNAEVKCWGLGDEGQLGNGKTDNLGDAASEMGEGLPVVDLGFDLKS